MAYPCGGVNNDERVAEVVRKHTGVRYARTITSTHGFDLQENLYRFNPSVHIIEDCLLSLAEAFLQAPSDRPQLYYIWGHAFDLDVFDGGWERAEKLFEMIANREDVFYGTNKEVLL